jgi:hypothetical protein
VDTKRAWLREFTDIRFERRNEGTSTIGAALVREAGAKREGRPRAAPSSLQVLRLALDHELL